MLLNKYLSFVAVLVVLFNVNRYVETAPHQTTIRLCSKSLSDALYLVCKDRGYNEPFSYNDGIDTQRNNGPGLVDECCYNSCSLEQLGQYCKPAIPGGDSDNGGIEESLRIVNLPFSRMQTLMKESMQEGKGTLKSKKIHHRHDSSYRENDRIDNSHKIIDTEHGWINKSVRQQKDMEKSMEMNGNEKIEELKYDNCERRRNTRRGCSKAQYRVSMRKVPNFMIGTILPESSDSVVLFPSKSHQDYWRVTKNFHSNSHKFGMPVMNEFQTN